MKRKQKLLNEITKLVKIKLLQEVSTPPEIDDILDKLNRLGGDKSKLSKDDLYTLDFYSEYGTVPEVEEEDYYEEEGMPLTLSEDEKDEWVEDFALFVGTLINIDDIPDDVDLSSLKGLRVGSEMYQGIVEDAPEQIMEYIEKNAHRLSSEIEVSLNPGDVKDIEEMIDQWMEYEINTFDFAENVALILLTGSSGEPFGM